VGYPDLDKLATHELTLPGRLLASVVLPAKMAFARDGLTRQFPFDRKRHIAFS
jgi:hypothetical protein